MDNLAVLKALGDASRLELMKVLLEGPLYTEQLCEKVRLAPSTVNHHMKKLVNAHLVQVEKDDRSMKYTLNTEAIDMTLKDLVLRQSPSTETDGRRLSYRNKVLRTFVKEGKVVQIPVQRRKRRVILEQMVAQFEESRSYAEKEVNAMLLEWHEDYCFWRREMIIEGLLAREKGKYWKRAVP